MRFVFFGLLCAAVALALPAAFIASSSSGSVPYRPWEQSQPRFIDGQSSVHDWFVDSLLLIEQAARDHLSGVGIKTSSVFEKYSNDDAELSHVLPDRYFSFLPTYVASAVVGGCSVQWKAGCFQDTSVIAASTFADENGDEGVTFTIKAESPRSKLCGDNYLLLTTEGISFHKIFSHGEHKIDWKFSKKISDENRAWIAKNGVRIFLFSDDVPSTLLDLLSTIELFSPVILPSPSVPKFAAAANIKFIKDYANTTMETRSVQNVDIDESLIHDGDFIAIIRLDGLDTMQVFGTGAHTGHTAMALRIDGSLYIVESTDKTNYWPKPHIQRTPYKEWISLARKADFNVRHLPLSPDARARFNASAAVEFFKRVEGMPYGYHNFLWGWVDTEDDNMPRPLTHMLVEPLFAIIARLEPAISNKMWELAFNKRLGTDGLNTDEIYATLLARNISFGQLISMPEQDAWVYPDGLSMVCDVLVCALYKAGGLFGDLADSIQCTEFQNWDVETLAFFDRNFTRPEQCVAADPDLPTCQLAGQYRMHLPGFGTVQPYAHMRENCGALPPNFVRNPGC